MTSYGYHTLYLAVAIAGVTSFIIALLVLSESKNMTDQPVKEKLTTGKILRGWLEIARNKGALIVSFVQACQYYVYGVVEFYLVQYMMQVAGFNALAVSVVMGVQIVSLIVSRPILGRFSDKSSRSIPIVLGCVISGLLLFFVPFTTQFPLLLAISIGYGLGFAMVISSTAPLMCDLTPPKLSRHVYGFFEHHDGRWTGSWAHHKRHNPRIVFAVQRAIHIVNSGVSCFCRRIFRLRHS